MSDSRKKMKRSRTSVGEELVHEVVSSPSEAADEAVVESVSDASDGGRFWKGSPRVVLVRTLCLFVALCLCVGLVTSAVFATATAVVPAVGVTLIDSTGFQAYEGDVSFLMWVCAYVMPHFFMTLLMAIFEYVLLVRACRLVMRAQVAAARALNARLDAFALRGKGRRGKLAGKAKAAGSQAS